MDDSEIDRLASHINFLREWRFFNYEPRVVRFAPETEVSSGTEALNEITLSQFTAAEVPKYSMEAELGPTIPVSAQSRKDFVLYVGGLVWALDWCPREEQGTESDINCQFLAVAAHPPDSTYHKLGAPLKGRGMVQIWCILNYTTNEDMQISVGSTKKKYKKPTVEKKAGDKPVRPRGRPRKNPGNKIPEEDPDYQFKGLVQLPEDDSSTPHADNDLQSIPASHDDMQAQKNVTEKENITYKRRKRKPRSCAKDAAPDDLLDSQFIPALAVQFPNTTDVFPEDEILQSDPVPINVKRKKQNAVNHGNSTVDDTADTPYSPTGEELQSSSSSGLGKRQKIPTRKALENDLDFTIASLKAKSRKKSTSHKHRHFDNSEFSTLKKCGGSSVPRHKENAFDDDGVTQGRDFNDLSSGGPQDKQNNTLPRAILCLGHDGKVAWDVKWRPSARECANKYRMGYLAVVLGDGSIEVWEVPSPEVVTHIYAFRQKKDTDPRFAKLKPVFRCSKLNYGDRRSMPLTVEWSASPPHDLLLAGCHDGVVAMWKFFTEEQSEDARPLLCFSADTGPIRSLMWAPFDGDSESSNVIVTAGHGGLKFWDLRDPYRPLWDANPTQRYIYGLDWLPDPGCVLVSYDDGNLRMLSLLRSAYDVPVTGEAFSGTMQQGIHSYNCSSYAIWSIHVSRLTGIVAYSCADGAVLYFQLTHKAVDKDPTRNRAPHFLCGSLASEGSAVTVNTELPSLPHRMKKSATEWANTPRSSRTVAAGLNYGKRVKKGAEKSTNHGDDVLALCYIDDPENGETQNSSKQKKADKNSSDKTDMKDKVRCEVETLPSKLQAMYRVRWNMNKGSERWLCYGGGAGIVRCQEIVIPEFDKKLLKK
ncbi:hypothetical protein vseg_012104 [Gypsophila vaccaria]